MVFSSLTFLFFFLPLSVLVYFSSRNIAVKNAVLLLFSLVFYAWGEPIWITILLLSAIIDYSLSLLIVQYRKKWIKRAFVLLSIVSNMGLLFTFKYSDFIVENVNLLTGSDFSKPGFLLPIGISFYTFQTLSYTLDVYKSTVQPQKNIISFFCYVCLFPQLVAGPIVRYSDVERQINLRPFDWAQVWSGINRFSFGLFKKVVIANTTGALVEKYLELNFTDLNTAEAWYGISLFSIQLYFDFSGYSDMAIGLGRIFGFDFPENFKNPYAAISVGDFYRRWHMTLGRFFRDYVYIPLGGNRRNQLFNIFLVWTLTGFWHGASWNFVMWGSYFGIIMVIEKLFENQLKPLPIALKHTYTLFLIVLSRAIFYFVDFDRLSVFMQKLFTRMPVNTDQILTDTMNNMFILVLAVLLCIPWNEMRIASTKLGISIRNAYHYMSFPIVLFFLAVSMILLVDSTYNPFIYFRF